MYEYTNSDCAFYEEGYCYHSEKPCKMKCKKRVRKYGDLTSQDYMNIYLQKKAKFWDFVIKWGTLIVSFIAICISIYTLKNK